MSTETTPTEPVATITAAAPAAPVTPVTPAPAVSPSAAEQAAVEAAAKAVAPVVPPVAPQPYTLALPKDAVIDASALERVTAFAKAGNLPPIVAQQALDLANAEVVADRARQSESQQASFKKLAFEQWPAEFAKHPTYGGDKYPTTVANIKRLADLVIAPYPARVEALNTTGWGNHPLLNEIFADIGARMANDGFVSGGGSGTVVKKSDADVLYGSSNGKV